MVKFGTCVENFGTIFVVVDTTQMLRTWGLAENVGH